MDTHRRYDVHSGVSGCVCGPAVVWTQGTEHRRSLRGTRSSPCPDSSSISDGHKEDDTLSGNLYVAFCVRKRWSDTVDQCGSAARGLGRRPLPFRRDPHPTRTSTPPACFLSDRQPSVPRLDRYRGRLPGSRRTGWGPRGDQTEGQPDLSYSRLHWLRLFTTERIYNFCSNVFSLILS